MPKNIKIKWRKRRWPEAYYPNGSMAAKIESSVGEGHTSMIAKSATNKPLIVYIADHSTCTWTRFKRRFLTLIEAKTFTEEVINNDANISSHLPEQYR